MATAVGTAENWAMMPFGADQVKALETNPSFSMTLKGVDQTWSLKGAAAAIAKVRACAANRGGTAAPAPAIPAPGKNCPAHGSLRSPAGTKPVEVMFVNLSKGPLDIYWIDFEGAWKHYKKVAPNSNVTQKTFGGHLWVAVDGRGTCHGGVMSGDPKNREEGANMFQIWD